jgi:hypothetical protein
MQTELQAIDSLRTQFAAAFNAMARDPYNWHVYQGPHDVILIQEDVPKVEWPVLVRNVHGMSVDHAVQALSDALRARAEKPAEQPVSDPLFDPDAFATGSAIEAIDQLHEYGDAYTSYRCNVRDTLLEHKREAHIDAALKKYDARFCELLKPLVRYQHLGHSSEGIDGTNSFFLMTNKDSKLTPPMAEVFMLSQVGRASSGPGSYYCTVVLAVQCKYDESSCFVTVQHRYDV